MAQEFFAPSNPFSISGWAVQNENASNSRTRAQALGADGDEIKSKLHDEKNSVSCTFVAESEDAPIPVVGSILGGYHIDTVAVNYTNTAFATMTVTAHKHNGTAHESCRTYKGTLETVGTLFGCPATLPCCTVSDALRSVTYNITANHQDETGASGEHLKGNNYDGSESFDVEMVDNGVITAADGWDCTTDNINKTNTTATTSSASFEKHIKHTAA